METEAAQLEEGNEDKEKMEPKDRRPLRPRRPPDPSDLLQNSWIKGSGCVTVKTSTSRRWSCRTQEQQPENNPAERLNG